MTPTPSPDTIIIQSPPLADWQVWAAFAPLIAAVIAGTIAGIAIWQKYKADNLALKQKTEADSRSEWWRRAQWALGEAMDSDPGRKVLGLAVLDVLARSNLASNEELVLFDAAWKTVPRVVQTGESTRE